MRWGLAQGSVNRVIRQLTDDGLVTFGDQRSSSTILKRFRPWRNWSELPKTNSRQDTLIQSVATQQQLEVSATCCSLDRVM